MPATRYNCWIAQEDGSTGRVDFLGAESCWPTPLLKRESIGSDHQMLPGADGPGLTLRQDFGWTTGTLDVVVPFVTRDTADAVQALCYRWANGARPLVQFHNGRQTWKCSWKSCAVTRREDCIDKYSLRFELAVVEEV